jgi:CBS domain-containing protein
MTQNPITVAPEETTHEAIRRMRARGIGSLPVVREGQLVGIVTERDLIELAARELDRLAEAD